MLDRLSVSVLLKAVIATLAAVVVIVLALGSWGSWSQLAATARIAAVADASAHMFTALHNLRSDRTRTFRFLQAEKAVAAIDPGLREVRDAEMPALKSALAVLQGVDFPERASVMPELSQRIKRLAALHEESAAALLRPKAERRRGSPRTMWRRPMPSSRCSTSCHRG